MSRKSKISLIISLLLIVAVVGINILLLPSLPDDIPMQWAADGSVNWSASKYTGTAMPVLIMAVILISAIAKKELGPITCLALGAIAALNVVLFTIVV